MKQSLPDSPVKLVRRSALCILIVCMFFLIPASRLVHSPLFGAWLLFGIVVVPTCGILPLKFVTDLRHGVEDERWTEAQLEPLRAHLESRYFTALSVALLVIYDTCPFLLHRRFEVFGGVSVFYYFLLFQFRLALKRPPSSNPPI